MGVWDMFPSTSVNDKAALDALLAARGNVNLAAERMGVNSADVVDAVSKDLPLLKRRTQAVTLIELLSLASTMRVRFVEALGQLEPEDAVKAYLDVMKLTVSMTDDKTSTMNLNVNETVFSQLDRDIQEAFVAAARAAERIDAGEVYEPAE